VTLTVIFPGTRPIWPEWSVTWGDRPDQDDHLKKNIPSQSAAYRLQPVRCVRWDHRVTPAACSYTDGDVI